ncbi:MAG: hypothetical protein A2V66_10815 [Ignavibacteria bacterium RBG_13_36_8]|nr:MAG: hypothetical protein A2V66_10815 [Ignavibacteria bacterium RBG_13_36_8]
MECLRSKSLDKLSKESVTSMLKKHNFYSDNNFDPDKTWYPLRGEGIKNNFKLMQDGLIVFDAETGLYWQQSGSPYQMSFYESEEYINKLNREKYGGYNDWRLPTLEEAISLLKLDTKINSLYIDPIFDWMIYWIWTGDKLDGSYYIWIVDFRNGGCEAYTAEGEFIGFNDYSEGRVRAVR